MKYVLLAIALIGYQLPVVSLLTKEGGYTNDLKFDLILSAMCLATVIALIMESK